MASHTAFNISCHYTWRHFSLFATLWCFPRDFNFWIHLGSHMRRQSMNFDLTYLVFCACKGSLCGCRDDSHIHSYHQVKGLVRSPLRLAPQRLFWVRLRPSWLSIHVLWKDWWSSLYFQVPRTIETLGYQTKIWQSILDWTNLWKGKHLQARSLTSFFRRPSLYK